MPGGIFILNGHVKTSLKQTIKEGCQLQTIIGQVLKCLSFPTLLSCIPFTSNPSLVVLPSHQYISWVMVPKKNTPSSPTSHSPVSSPLRPCQHLRPPRRYSYNLSPAPDHLPPPPSHSLSKQPVGQGQCLRRGDLYRETLSVRESRRSRSRETVYLEAQNNSFNRPQLLEQLNSSLLQHPPRTNDATTPSCTCKCQQQTGLRSAGKKQSYLSFKSQKDSTLQLREQTDNLQAKYEQLWSQNHHAISRGRVGNVSQLCPPDSSLQDITHSIVTNQEPPSLKHHHMRFGDRISRRELLQISNSKPTHRGQHPRRNGLIESVPLLFPHHNLPYPPPPLPQQTSLLLQQQQIDGKLVKIDDFNQQIVRQVRQITSFLSSVVLVQ